MSKERELLERAIQLIDDAYEGKIALSLCNEIKELLAQPEQDQDPVAWKVVDRTTGDFMFSRVKPMERSYKYDVVIPLYTAPKRYPLTNEEICEILLKKEWKGFVELVRIIEKEHGIGGGE
jgi:hypothetical protein